MGPVLPPNATEEEFDPEEIKKAEEYKTNGNNFFKGKFNLIENCKIKVYIFCR